MTASERQKVWVLSSWLVSAIVHLSVAILTALWLCPARQSEQAATTLHVAWAADEPVEVGVAQFTSASLDVPDSDPAESPVWNDTSDEDAVTNVSLWGRGGKAGRRASGARQGGSANPATGTAGEDSSHAEFFGTVAYGDRFVFLLDMSLSMDGSVDQQGTRFDRARDELIRSIEQLHPGQSFCVTLFCYKTRPMFDDPLHGREYLPATAENKERLKAWLRRVTPEPGTDPREALTAGLALRPSAVFLLSDGDFNGPKRDLEGIFQRASELQDSADNAQHNRVPVHTIAYEDPVGAQNMRELSDRSGGEYRFVEGSPEAKRNPTGGQRSVTNSADQTAARWLTLGKGHQSLGRTQKAVAQYRLVVAKYPTTPAAREAATRIEQLTRESAESE